MITKILGEIKEDSLENYYFWLIPKSWCHK